MAGVFDIEVNAMADAMVQLNRAVRGMPDRGGSVRRQQKKLAKLVADLHTELRWARARVTA